jgi:hypothetical protein
LREQGVFTVEICARYVNNCRILVYVASIVMGYGMDGTGFISRKGQDVFFFPNSPDLLKGPTSLLLNGYWGSVLGGKKARA